DDPYRRFLSFLEDEPALEEVEMRLDPYLNFSGNAREALQFYNSVFGGELYVISFRDFGGAGQPEAEQDGVMHGSVTLPNGDVLMASDVPSSMGGVTKGNGTAIMVSVESVEEAERIFRGLSAGGNVGTQLGETDFAERYGYL